MARGQLFIASQSTDVFIGTSAELKGLTPVHPSVLQNPTQSYSIQLGDQMSAHISLDLL